MNEFEKRRRKHLEDARALTRESIERLSWTRERVIEEQTRRLRLLVAHAQQHSAFHAKRLGAFEASKLELEDLRKMPVMTKADVMNHWDEVVTDGRLHLEDLNRHLQDLLEGRTENAYYLGRYYAAATGGSSGKRGLFLWDWETYSVMLNLAFRFELRADQRRPSSREKRTAVVCAGSMVHGSRFLYPAMLDADRQSLTLSAGQPLGEMVSQLNEFQPDRLISYSSVLGELLAESKNGQLNIRPDRVSVNSEPLPDRTRELAIEAWGINIHNQWGSVEVGIAGSEAESFQGMTLAEDVLVIEPVDAHDQPAKGAQADRLLVTKLYGQVMPLIRYEMTDTVVLSDHPSPDAPGYRMITEVKGRADSWFQYAGGIKVHPMVFRGVLGQSASVAEYQVQQTDRGARVLVVAQGEVSEDFLRQSLVNELKVAGLPDAEVEVQLVGELPRHRETNKLKRFVPLPAT